MQLTLEDLKNELKSKNISLSHQRLKVLEYLAKNRIHPTADLIYTELHKEISTLSRTTVYNTLRVLTDAGLVREITIGENETRYDIETYEHGHFRCESCGTIYNFRMNTDLLKSDDLNNFHINEKSIYFKGVCPKCLVDIKKIKED